MSELELKFRLDAEASLRWQALFKAQGAKRLHLRARYFDTPDARLGAAGIALRLRLEGQRWVQTLKASGESAVHRLEHEVTVAGTGREPPTLDLARHAGSPALERLQRVLPDDDAAAQLVQRYETDVWRSIMLLRDADGSCVEAALDLGHVIAGDAQAPIAELELEHVAGRVQAVFVRSQEALGTGGMWLSTLSKAEQGESLRRGTPSEAVKASPLVMPVHAHGTAFLRAVLHNVLAQVLPNASQVAEGRADAEPLHQTRVGLRRLRTALRELATFSPHIDPAWEPVLAATFRALGERRDNEVVAESVRPLLEAAGAPKVAWAAVGAPDPVEVVRSVAFQRTLVDLLALAHAVDGGPDAGGHPAQVRERVAAGLGRLHRQVVDEGRRFTELPLERQHRVRKRVKRLRYLSEFALPLWRKKDVDRYLGALRPVQDALGWHADCAAAEKRFVEDAKTDPAAQFAAGFLKAHLSTTARAAHRQLKGLAKAERYWGQRKQPR